MTTPQPRIYLDSTVSDGRYLLVSPAKRNAVNNEPRPNDVAVQIGDRRDVRVIYVDAAEYGIASAAIVAAVRGADGAALIAGERRRQVDEEGWTPEHDDDVHAVDELALAAVCYAMPEHARGGDSILRAWPWAVSYWKPCPDDRVRELVKAGALIAAEIDRLLRAAATSSEVTR